jgi:hypothetical protein
MHACAYESTSMAIIGGNHFSPLIYVSLISRLIFNYLQFLSQEACTLVQLCEYQFLLFGFSFVLALFIISPFPSFIAPYLDFSSSSSSSFPHAVLSLALILNS